MATKAQTATKPWHPCHDGLLPIAEALATVAAIKWPGIVRAVTGESNRPNQTLAWAIYHHADGDARHRLDLLDSWLRLNGFGSPVADRLPLLPRLLHDTRLWEERARGTISARVEQGAATWPLPTDASPDDYLDASLREDFGQLQFRCRQLSEAIQADAAAMQIDAEGWIPANQAEAELGWTHKQLVSFANEYPQKLRIRKPHKQRMEVWAADVLNLKSKSSRQDFDALGTPAADKMPGISEASIEQLAVRLSQTRANKARK